jgi:hypothetical protein
MKRDGGTTIEVAATCVLAKLGGLHRQPSHHDLEKQSSKRPHVHQFSDALYLLIVSS